MIGLFALFFCVASTALGFGAGVVLMRSRWKRLERDQLEQLEARWLRTHSTRTRNQVIEAMQVIRGRGYDIGLPEVSIICRHLGVRP